MTHFQEADWHRGQVIVQFTRERPNPKSRRDRDGHVICGFGYGLIQLGKRTLFFKADCIERLTAVEYKGVLPDALWVWFRIAENSNGPLQRAIDITAEPVWLAKNEERRHREQGCEMVHLKAMVAKHELTVRMSLPLHVTEMVLLGGVKATLFRVYTRAKRVAEEGIWCDVTQTIVYSFGSVQIERDYAIVALVMWKHVSIEPMRCSPAMGGLTTWVTFTVREHAPLEGAPKKDRQIRHEFPVQFLSGNCSDTSAWVVETPAGAIRHDER